MRKLLAILLLFYFCSPLNAGQWAIGTREGMFVGDDDNMGHKEFPIEALNVSYLINKYIGIELETNYGQFKTMKNQWSNGSKWKEEWTTLNLQLRYPLNKRLTVYGVYGYGYSFFFDKHIAYNEVMIAKQSRAIKYGGGAEWKLNKRLSLNGEVTYHYSDTKAHSTIDMWGWLYTVGAKYYF